MADLQFSAAIDDTRFVRQLANMEREAIQRSRVVNDSFGSWGKSIDTATGGVRKFTGSVSGSVGTVTTMLGVWGLVVGTVASGVAALSQFERQQREIERSAAREAVQRERVLRSLDAELGRRREMLGLTTSLEARVAGIRADNSALQEQVATDAKLAEARTRLETLERTADQLRSISETSRRNPREDLIYGGEQGSTRLERADAEIKRLREQIANGERILSEITSTGSGLEDRLRSEGIATGLREQARLEADLAKARGDGAEALRLREGIDHQERLARIAELESAGANNAERLRSMADDLHTRRLAHIDTEEQRRRQSEAQQVETERIRAASERDRAKFSERALDIELLRLRGLEDAARAAQVRLDIERQIRDLTRDPSRSAAERERITRKLREIEELRLSDLGAPGTATGLGGARVAALGATLTGAERQVFGMTDHAARAAAATEQVKSVADGIRSILHAVTAGAGGAVKVTGDFAARWN